MFSSKKLFFVLCVTLNIVDLNCDKKLWSSSYGPNFDPDFPQFTPFNSDQFINVESDVRVSQNSETSESHTVDDTNLNSDDKSSSNEQSNNEETKSGEPQYFYSEKVVNPVKNIHLRERMKPLKNFVMGLYQNYRSTYLDNKTVYDMTPKMKEVENKIDAVEIKDEPPKIKRRTKKKTKKPAFGDEIRYNVGPGVNVSLDHEKELVNVYLDEDCLKDVFTGTVTLRIMGKFSKICSYFFF